MASGLPNPAKTPPKKRKSTSQAPRISINEPSGGGNHEPVSFSFSFTCDDEDDNDNDNAQPPNPWDEPATTATTTSSSSSHLHPHSRQNNLLRPPGQEVTYTNMSSEDGGVTNGGTSGGTSSGSPPKNPFNFQTQFMDAGPVKSNIGQRRGHRYKHSSISASHSFFQEPPPRPPPVLPASLPIPTLKEAWSSMQRDQKSRLLWSCAHAAVACYVFFSAEDSLAMTALSHLVFFDVGSAAVSLVVDVLGNFEVWRRSSIRHPFGLQRAEVLAGFAMSIFLVFGGFDLISHNLKHALETVGEHDDPHHTHANPRDISPGTIHLASLAAAASTLMSAYGLRNHTRIRRVMRVPLPYLSSILPGAGILANPFHFLTLCFSFLMLLLPLVSVPYFVWLDRVICAAIAACMFILGTRLAVAQGLMLLMSYSGEGNANSASIDKKDGKPIPSNTRVSAVVREIESEPQVARVEEAQFWQVHYGLAMANLKVCLVRGANTSGSSGGGGMFGGHDDNTIAQLRSRLARVVQNRLGGEGYGRGGSLRWEVTVQMSTDGK